MMAPSALTSEALLAFFLRFMLIGPILIYKNVARSQYELIDDLFKMIQPYMVTVPVVVKCGSLSC
ncbi:hypothetical protein BJ165DRAFT_1486904 [Panaeolus papilionaceus]|nr:hypothetical protein BJ165DRAFT_1486904 [Panaeolus papilionaceus]